eukprot:417113_1
MEFVVKSKRAAHNTNTLSNISKTSTKHVYIVPKHQQNMRKTLTKQSIRKEDRLLSTWSKIEIADLVEEEWNRNRNMNQNTAKVLSYVHKIKRERKFDGKHLSKLNDRNLNILAQRCLGLKKGGSDYKLFMHCMRQLKRTYCGGKKKRKLYATRYHSFYNKQTPHNWKNKTDTKQCNKGTKAAFEFPGTSQTAPKGTAIRLSVTSPACSDDETYGVTADELLSLISCGQCDSEDESSTCDVQQYIYQNYKNYEPNVDEMECCDLYAKYDGFKHKTTVIPSILTVSDHATPTICLSPHAYALNNDASMYHSMTDESTDQDDEECDLTLHQ